MASAGSVTVSPYQNGAQSITTTGAVSAGATTVTSLTAGAGTVTTTGTLHGGILTLSSGTLPTTGLLRFPKPSEFSALAMFRREASAVDIPILTTDTSSGLTIGDVATGAFHSLYLKADTNVDVLSPALTLREAGGTTRATWTIAAAALLNVAASTSLAVQYNGTTRFAVDSTGLAFYAGTPRAQPAITGALSAVTDANAKAVLTSIIAALAPAAGVNLATNGTT